MALDQHRARALSITTSERANTRGRLVAGLHEHEMDRPRERRAGRDVDHGAVAHEGGVERDRDVVGRHHLAEMRSDQRIAGRQRLAPSSGWSGRARDRRDRTSSGTKAPSTKTMRRASMPPAWRRHRLARALAAASGTPASGLASRISARRSVYFHSSTRRCGRPRLEAREAASRSAATALARQLRLRPGEARRQRGSAAVLIGRISAFIAGHPFPSFRRSERAAIHIH